MLKRKRARYYRDLAPYVTCLDVKLGIEDGVLKSCNQSQTKAEIIMVLLHVI